MSSVIINELWKQGGSWLHRSINIAQTQVTSKGGWLAPPPPLPPLLGNLFLIPPPLFTFSLSMQSLYSGVDDLRDTKVDKDMLEVEVREVSYVETKNG